MSLATTLKLGAFASTLLAAPAFASCPAGSFAEGPMSIVPIEYTPISAKDYGKCSFDSDCNKGVKCRSSKCADSAGSSCSFDSDCGGGGAKCRSSKCSNAPDGSCSFDSECPGKKCSSSKCK